MFPPKDRLTICFAHAAYQLQERFLRRQLTITSFEVRTLGEFERRIGEADVVVVSGRWHNDVIMSILEQEYRAQPWARP